MDALLRATRRFAADEAVSLASELIGLGPGLTPSGDDFLVGYLAGLRCSDPTHRDFVQALGEGISRLSGNTTLVSRCYLAQAVQGRVSSVLMKLAQSMSGESHTIGQAARSALNVGSTSGPASVLGLLLGVQAWSNDLPQLFQSRGASTPTCEQYDDLRVASRDAAPQPTHMKSPNGLSLPLDG
jgi:hypothetical protein